MKVSLDWISDFVDLPKGLSDREIAEGLTLGLCEVEGLERPGAVFQSVVAAKITAVEKHPKADKLKLAAVDLGGGKSVTVVCGAPNCRAGITVPYAAVGTTLPGGLTLEPKTIRGILSKGMLCSEEELGLSAGPGDSGGAVSPEGPGGRGGIMELPEGTPAGTRLSDLPEISGRRGGPGAEGESGAEGIGPGIGPGAGGPEAESRPGGGGPGGEGPDTPAAADDLILDIDNKSLTHRPDCWGHYGLAREFAAIFSRPFRDRFSPEWAASLKERISADGAAERGTAGGGGEGVGGAGRGTERGTAGGPGEGPVKSEAGSGSQRPGGPAENETGKGTPGGVTEGPGAAGTGEAPVSVHVDPDSSNLGFLGLSINIDPGVSAGVSPPWMRRRLAAAGMRPINAVVDISNYVMLETGIPNHIFDRAAIRGGRIVVRRAGADQDFITLDGQRRRLLASDTLVCDAERPLAAAGVMGGLESSVGADTTAIMVEAANWKDSEVRRTAARLGLRTDASQRYEKSLDSARLEICLLRIYELIRKISPGARAAGGIQRENMPKPPGLVIPTSPGRIAAVLGEGAGSAWRRFWAPWDSGWIPSGPPHPGPAGPPPRSAPGATAGISPTEFTSPPGGQQKT